MILAMMLAGTSIPVSKMLTGRTPVFAANALSLLFGCILLLPAGIRFFKGMKRNSLRCSDLRYPALQGLFGMALFRVCTFYGLKFLPAVEGGLLTAAGPAIMALSAYVLLKERPDRYRMAAIALTAAGIAVLQWQPAAFRFSLKGTALILAAMVFETLLTIFRKKAVRYIPPAENTFLIMLFCLVYLLPAVAIEAAVSPSFEFPFEAVFACMYLGLFGSALAYICWGYAAPRLPAGTTGIISGMMPLTAAAVSILLFGEEVRPRHVVGGILVLGALLLSALSAISSSKVSGPGPSICVSADVSTSELLPPSRRRG